MISPFGGLDLLARDDKLGIAVAQLQRRAEDVVIGDGEHVYTAPTRDGDDLLGVGEAIG